MTAPLSQLLGASHGAECPAREPGKQLGDRHETAALHLSPLLFCAHTHTHVHVRTHAARERQSEKSPSHAGHYTCAPVCVHERERGGRSAESAQHSIRIARAESAAGCLPASRAAAASRPMCQCEFNGGGASRVRAGAAAAAGAEGPLPVPPRGLAAPLRARCPRAVRPGSVVRAHTGARHSPPPVEITLQRDGEEEREGDATCCSATYVCRPAAVCVCVCARCISSAPVAATHRTADS